MLAFRSAAAALTSLAYLAGASPALADVAPRERPVQYADSSWSRPSCRGLDGRDRARCERHRAESRARERARERREDERKEDLVKGLVGAAIVGGVIAAIASDKKKDKAEARRRYCLGRYGNYEPRTDSYLADDGRYYRCE